MQLQHAMETPTATFIVGLYNKQMAQGQVVEVNDVGLVLRQFSGSRLSSLCWTQHIAVDSRGNIFVADENNHRILLLDSRLTLRRTIQLNNKLPKRLCWNKQSGQLLVALWCKRHVMVFDVLCR